MDFFGEIHQSLSGQLYHYIFKLTNDSFKAEEITQEAFIKLWENRVKLEGVKHVKPYLYSIAKNLLIDDFNITKKKRAQILTSDYVESKNPLTILEYEELDGVLNLAISSLNGIPKKVYSLSREEKLSYQEISEVLGISKVAVKKQMMKALDMLRKKIHPYLDVELLLVFGNFALFF